MINIKIHQKRGGHKLHCHREEKMYEKKNSSSYTYFVYGCQFRHVYNLSCIHILHCIGCLGIKDINFFIPAKNNGNGDEPYTVTMVLNGSTQPDEERIEQKINEILEPELNANLDIVVLPWASASQQLQLMLSGDEKIDVFYTQATCSSI